MQITLGGYDFTVNVLLAKRKKMVLEVSPEGYVTLKAPSKSTEAEWIEFVQANSKQLIDYKKRMEKRATVSTQKSYNEEEYFLYLGKACLLSDILKEMPESQDEIQAALYKFYTMKTREFVKSRVAHYEPIIGVKAKSVTVVDSPKTWGTCNSRKELTFNYKLAMAPLSVIDYVVIHELCHIHHMNHDRSFWRKVGSFDPKFKEHQDYLAQFGGFMTI